MENLKVGQKVRIKSKEWYDACKCLGFKLPKDKNIFGMCHIGEVGKIECIFSVWISVKFYDGDSDLFHKGWLEPIENQVTIQNDMETNKLILNGITLPKGTEAKVSVEEGATIITFQKQESESKEPKFKDGEMLFLTDREGRNYIAIFKSEDDEAITIHGWLNTDINEAVVSLDDDDIFLKKNIEVMRYATDDEIAEFNKEFAEQKHLKWNAEEFKFEELRWRAEKGTMFYFINQINMVSYMLDFRQDYEQGLFDSNNYFKTRELANKALPKWKEFFKNLNI